MNNPSTLPDKTLHCRDCSCDFVLTGGEQDWYKAQDFKEPLRCKACRQRKKAAKKAAGIE